MTSKPKALAILIGAGPTSGLGIARTLVQNGYGVACLARNADRLEETVEKIRQQTGQKAVEGFSTDTQPSNLTFAFEKIRSHPSFEGLKLKLALFHIKHSSREPFLETSPESYGKALEEYNVGAFAFAQQVLKRVYEESGGQTTLKESDGEKKCTLIFTGTVSAFDLREVGWQHGKELTDDLLLTYQQLGALRTNTNFAAYGATRSAARSLAQAIAKEREYRSFMTL